MFVCGKQTLLHHKQTFVCDKQCSFGRDLISSGSKEDTLLCNTLCSVTRTRCFVTNTLCSVGKALLSSMEKLSCVQSEVTFLVARWLQGAVSPVSESRVLIGGQSIGIFEASPADT